MPKTLQQLEKFRSCAAESLVNIVNALTEPGRTLSQRVLEARIRRLEHVKALHESFIEEMLTHDEADTDDIYDQADKFEDVYFEALKLVDANEKRLVEGETWHAQRPKDDAEKLVQRDQEKAEAREHIDNVESQLVAFKLFVDDLEPEIYSLVTLKRRLNSAEPLLCHYNAASYKAQVNQQERSDFENCYFHVIGALARAIDAQTPASPPGNNNNAVHPVCVASKLKNPSIELPKFDGIPDTWIDFRDTFKTLIHDSKEIAGAIKVRYLMTSIRYEHSSVVHLHVGHGAAKIAITLNQPANMPFDSNKPAWEKANALVAVNGPRPKSFKCTFCHDVHLPTWMIHLDHDPDQINSFESQR